MAPGPVSLKFGAFEQLAQQKPLSTKMQIPSCLRLLEESQYLRGFRDPKIEYIILQKLFKMMLKAHYAFFKAQTIQ